MTVDTHVHATIGFLNIGGVVDDLEATNPKCPDFVLNCQGFAAPQ